MPLSHTTTRFRPAAKGTQGSALVTVIIFSVLLLLLCASIMRYGVQEDKATKRHRQFLAAKNAAESIAEYGFYQVRKTAESNNDFNVDSKIFLTGKPLAPTLPSQATLDLFKDTGVVTDLTSPYAPVLATGNIDIVSSGGGLYYVDPRDKNNSSDPLRGKYVFRRDVGVYAKATVLSDDGAPITVYMTEAISVRGAPLFAHAIFYNMDLELFPGPKMEIYGPVHANGNIYTDSQGSDSLHYHSIVTASGDIFHAWKNNQAGARGTGDQDLGMNPVYFYTPSGTAKAMLNGSTWADSTMGASTTNINNRTMTLAAYQKFLSDAATANKVAFRQYAQDTWQNNVMTSAHEIQVYKPVAIGEYKEDTTPTDGIDQSVNSGRLMIEPVLDSSSADYDASVEVQKYAANAGIYLSVNPVSGAITATSRKKNALGTSKTLTIPSGNKLAKWIPYTQASTVTRTVVSSVKNAKNSSKYDVTTTVYTSTNTYTSAGVAPSTPVITSNTTKSAQSTSSTSDTTSEGAKSYVSGMYDQRRAAGINLVEIDMNALRSVVTEMQKASGSRDATLALGDLEPADWTGIVYVAVEGALHTAKDGSTVAGTAASLNTGVRIINGTTSSTAPLPSYTGSGLATQELGLSIATNTALYVKGHYNADGNITDTTSPTDPETNEKPAALIGDSFTVLAADWTDAAGQSLDPASSGDTEIAAAVLSGLVPTNKNGSVKSSGGAHNFIRFLQSLDGQKVAIRGSIVSLFESRMNPGNYNGSVYYPPTRLWGFSRQFAGGTYPPGTPRVLSYRRVNFTSMKPDVWTKEVADLK